MEHQNTIIIIFSGIVALSTTVYAILTWRLVSETKKLRKIQYEPRITIFIEPTEISLHLVNLVIENIGSGAAYDIKFDINPDFEYLKGKFLSELNIMKNIKYLPPNRRIEFFLTNLLDDFEKLTKIRFDIKSTYNDYFGEIHNESFGIDFSELKDISRIENTPLKDIAKSIDKISKDFRHITSGFKRLYTKTIIENERELEE